ncbi:DUF3576 domain-containing protein [Roseobacter sp. EG26]|uniref:DUF3576 domain-containing protein n=1 Tax=Roseobacter sp. EG26 TaxID=3412477 RepID=UPI003CE47126
MTLSTIFRVFGVIAIAVALSGCGGTSRTAQSVESQRPGSSIDDDTTRIVEGGGGEGTTIWDAFRRQNTEITVAVNKYLWSASLEVLNFLPVQSVDPFTGVIVTGFGTPPGGGRSYRATVLINDPALDARSLNVSVQTKGGPANAATVRAIEDAILSRARQLRIADNRL